MNSPATVPNPTLNECACGCGELTRGHYKRGHKVRSDAGRVTPLPGPDDDLDEPEPDDQAAEPEPEPDDQAADAEPEPEPGEVRADKPAGRLKEGRSGGKARTKIRVTAAVRRDVEAKIRFVLVPAGTVWQARDPLCGMTFVAQEPEISASLAELVCESPDLLAWFTGPAGGFMRYFRLIMALQPVALAIWAHHIAHGMPMVPADGQQPAPMPAFAA